MKMLLTKLKKYALFIVVLFTLVVGVGFVYAAGCPDGMSDEACLDYLRNLQDEINSAQTDKKLELSSEELAQKNLYEQINYYRTLIKQKELRIEETELELESLNIEVKILSKEIVELRNTITTVQQEIDNTREQIQEQFLQSYIISKISTIEAILITDDFNDLMRMLFYIEENRKKNLDRMSELKVLESDLNLKRDVLAKKDLELKSKKSEIENQKSVLYTENQDLLSKKSELDTLVAESEKREAAYRAELNNLQNQRNQLDNNIAALIMKMYQSGQLGQGTFVKQGTQIANQGHTGCSFGSHLHFGIVYEGSYVWSANVNPFSNGMFTNSGNYLYSGSARAPMNGTYITQWFHSGMYLDLVSLTDGVQTGEMYFVSPGSLRCSPGYSGWNSLQGEGAPVYAIMDGTVYYDTESWGGAKFAMVKHNNGYISMYVHIK